MDRGQRERHLGQTSVVVWMTGLSGAGKTTLARGLERRLHDGGFSSYVIDGDDIRTGLSADLGFSPADRSENLRRTTELLKCFVDAGLIIIASFVSPLANDRALVRGAFAAGEFFEIYCSCPLSVCEQRDAKGLYRKARSGGIPDFTGISAPYEPPVNAELVIDSANLSAAECVELAFRLIAAHVTKTDAAPTTVK